MAFTLITDDDGASTEYGDDDDYTFNNAGLLVIETASGRHLTFSPTAWRFVDAPKPESSMYAM